MNNFDEHKQRISELKKELNAVIVAHNYQRDEVQDIADFTGDSLELARKCTETDAETIVFCGVRFMAESAAILNPDKTVLLTDMSAGCPLADMITVDDLREWKERYPKAAVICYINSSAEIKAESDYCCTSANAIKVVNSIPDSEILFIPDQCLGHYASTQSDKRIILYPGYCYVHWRLKPEHIIRAKELHPDAKVIVHPECIPEVIALADAALSTSQMLRYAKENPAETFLIGTEIGLLHRLKQENPGKEFIPLSLGMVCSDMKKTTLEKIIDTMEKRGNVVAVPEDVRVRAKQALDRMLALV
jgi:quinolinate synthase